MRAFLIQIEPAALVILAAALRADRAPAVPDDAPPVARSTLRTHLTAFAGEPDEESVGDRFDDAVSHAGVVAYLTELLKPSGPEAAYNLACCYTWTEQWEEARRRLLYAVEIAGEGLGREALEDPTLDAYRADEQRLEELEHMVLRITDPAPPRADRVLA